MNTTAMDETDLDQNELKFKLASPQHRLGGYAVNSALAFVTLGIGWFVWSLIVWGQGQTPGHQILKMRVYSAKSHKPATWGKMFKRMVVVPLFYSLPVFIYIGLGFWLIAGDTHKTLGIFLLIFGYVISLVINLLDSLWIFKGEVRQRLVDVFADTVVINESMPLGVITTANQIENLNS